MTKVPVNVTTAAPTTSEMTCGVNTELIDGQCVCVTNWTNDPALPGTTHCPCPDLCAAHVVTCPAESTCYHLTCNLVTCSCPQHYKFDPFTASCQSPCQYFGDEVCGLGSGKKCKDSAEAERDYTCQCGSGYILANDTCQDVDECSGTGSSGVCGDTEQCVNVPGSHKCPCKQGYLRGSQGSCINVNECLNPSLHDCDHICVDTDPPAMYTCSCYTGYTWNDTQRRCVLNDISTGCECNDPERSLCYQPPGGEKQCSPRPGYKLQNSTFVDAAECVDKENVQAWCWKGGKCVEGEGGSRCECQDGYINVTLDYGRCTALECPAGTVVSGSQCVGKCEVHCIVSMRAGSRGRFMCLTNTGVFQVSRVLHCDMLETTHKEWQVKRGRKETNNQKLEAGEEDEVGYQLPGNREEGNGEEHQLLHGGGGIGRKASTPQGVRGDDKDKELTLVSKISLPEVLFNLAVRFTPRPRLLARISDNSGSSILTRSREPMGIKDLEEGWVVIGWYLPTNSLNTWPRTPDINPKLHTTTVSGEPLSSSDGIGLDLFGKWKRCPCMQVDT
ncbi:fibrillin-3-like [Homarus americanus]|uniref:fibrillin-3-like n=1 Tax=Homarus americanus TaxID=6706 RepID=UPI001C45B39A|nr:fibrillin-3-like [Homarus americanus]